MLSVWSGLLALCGEGPREPGGLPARREICLVILSRSHVKAMFVKIFVYFACIGNN